MFKAGDKVRVLSGQGHPAYLNEGQIYTVKPTEVWFEFVRLEETDGGWIPSRFELVQEETELLKVGDKVRISAQGREQYISTHQNPFDEVTTLEEVLPENEYCYVVSWENFACQNYRKDELELVEEETPLGGN